ncbi:MAG TPA: phosphopantetheine-binding protein [Vicinamibacterales bacterium]|nr:phosphopantetheine-binding protein [Vicinamibacterales bacterium]
MSPIDTHVITVLSRASDLPPASLTRDAALVSLGIGSLERIECMLALEDELQVELPDADLRELRTVQDLIDAVTQAVAAAPRRAAR